MKIRLVGHGKMGRAFAEGLSRLGYQVEIHNKEEPSIGGEEVVVLAVKPNALAGLPGGMEKSLILSVMTGIPMRTLQRITGSRRVVRCMPNLPVGVGQGVIGWVASEGVLASDRTFADQLFQAMGLSLELEKEELLDAITALSGSGPAYYFYLTELLAEKGEQMGFSQGQAQALARMTLIGAASLLQHSDHSATYWREQVTSPGGTTAAALKVLSGISPLVSEAIDQAYRRAKEQGLYG